MWCSSVCYTQDFIYNKDTLLITLAPTLLHNQGRRKLSKNGGLNTVSLSTCGYASSICAFF